MKGLSFEAALAAEEQRIAAGVPYRSHYVACGRYAEQLERYWEAFGRSAVQVFTFEEVVRDAGDVCRRIFEHLGLEPGVQVDTSRRHNPSGAQRSRLAARLIAERSGWKEPLKRVLPAGTRQWIKGWLQRANRKQAPPMEAGTRQELCRRLRPEVERLEEALGRDLSAWKEG